MVGCRKKGRVDGVVAWLDGGLDVGRKTGWRRCRRVATQILEIFMWVLKGHY